MISIRNYESASGMGSSDGYSSIEGAIRQSTDNPIDGYELTLLLDRKVVIGQTLIQRGDSLFVMTVDEEIPIYAFKMDNNLQRILKDGYDIWNS
jgi:hypothetical protein